VDLNSISEILAPSFRAQLPAMGAQDAWLAGGTWLFSEPQPGLRRLVDLSGLGWPAINVTPDMLEIAATCTIATLAAFEPPPDWVAGPLIVKCCRAFLGSFKIWNMATVGGNICMALPAGPMTSLASALDATALIWMPGGGERRMLVRDFVLGPQQTALRPGELLRRIDIPIAMLRRRAAFRQISLSPQGRSGALLIGTRGAGLSLTVTAATIHPVRLEFSKFPSAEALRARLEADIADEKYYDDVHGSPEWRRHITKIFGEDIRAELEKP
jgi:CO/xanthine dehydrogenase FAD-binding subunit